MFNALKRVLSTAEIEARRIEQVEGVGADTVLRALGPLIDRRMDSLILQLIKTNPDYDTLLDLRAQISEVYRIQSELKSIKEAGKEAGEALSEIFSPSN